MLRMNRGKKLYSHGDYPMPASRSVPPRPADGPTRTHRTFGRIAYWLCVGLISKRIFDNVVFLVQLPSISSPPSHDEQTSHRGASLRTPPQAHNLPTPRNTPIATSKADATNPKPAYGDKNGKEEIPGFNSSAWSVEFAAPQPQNAASERKICFLTCSYAKSANDMDPLVIVKNYNPNYVRFFLFTNLNDDQWDTPGWNKITTHYNYTRVITHSRYGKFLSWKYPEIRDNCDAVFYMDSVIRPNPNKILWDNIATTMLNDNYEHVMANKNATSNEEIRNTITNDATNHGNLTKYLTVATGFMQHNHPRNRTGIYNEIQAIQWAKKDFKKNVKALMNWFRKQPEGFDHFTPVYLNQCFGYNPNSKVFQMISEDFWDHYSKETDSWRDQPLWSFMLRRYLVRPTIFPYPQENLWQELDLENFGHGGHQYATEADVKMQGKR